MKHSLRLFSLLLLLVMAGTVSSGFAQATRYAFVNKERTLIFVYEGEQKDTLFLPIPAQKFRAERIAVLGSTSDGKSLLVGGKIMYAAIGSGVQDSIVGFFRIPIPEHGKPLDMTTMLTQGRVLARVDEQTTKILPLGAISPDNNRWYGIWMSAAPNNPDFKIYSGNFNENAQPGNANVTIASISGANAFDAGYHMTNITTTEDGGMLMFAVFDKLQSGGLERAQLIRWIPGQAPALTTFEGQINAVGPGPSADKAMGFAVRGLGTSSSPRLQMAVVTAANDDEIKIYEIPNPKNPSFAAGNVKATINRSSLPNNLDFFTGYTGNNDDVYSEAPQQGNGGDMMFNRDGSKVIFVTREQPEDVTIRNQSSAIYEYDLNGGSINLLYNDETKQERQPIFVDGTGIIPAPEQIVDVTPGGQDFGTVEIGSSATKRFTITNSGTVDASITSVSVNGDGYTITGNSLGLSAPFATTLAPTGTAWFDVTFTPTQKGAANASFTVAYAADKTITKTMTGSGKEKPGNESVARDYTEVFTFTIAPNPMSSSSVITIKGAETATANLELIDATGRAVWSTASKLTAGSTSTFDLNAQELAAGSYFLVVRASDVQAVRQVVITK